MEPARFLFHSYRTFYRFRQWRKRHVTAAGVMVLAAFFISVLFSANMSRSLVYQAAVLFALVLAAAAAGTLIPFRPVLKIRRYLPEYGTAQAELRYEIEIHNRSEKEEKGLVLFEVIQDPRPSFERFISAREPHESRRNAWDRKTLYYRWLWLVRKNAKTAVKPVPLPHLPPGETVRIKMSCFVHCRGYLSFQRICIGRPDLLGLFNRIKLLEQPDKVLVLPQMGPVEPMDLRSARHYHQGGVNLASSVGNSDEFMALRDYRPGDPMRNIHWKSAAKMSQLVTREFEDEHFVRYALILDTFASSDNEDLFEAAVSMAASYVCQLQGPEAILDLLFTGRRVFSFTAGRGLGQVGKMLEVLACVEPSPKDNMQDLMPALHQNIGRISGTICIFLDWDADRKRVHDLFRQAGAGIRIRVVSRDPETMNRQLAADMGETQTVRAAGI